jgi:hypothetical protein
MKGLAGKRLTWISWLLLVLAVPFFGLIGVLVYWGGRIESTLLVLGEPVFVTLDAGRPRIWLLFSLPLALVAGALATRKARDPK